MYVCICNSVTESDIHDAVDDGVRTLEQLTAATACSTDCGACMDMAQVVLTEALFKKRKYLQIVPSREVA